ncbi:13965_t:CDS:2 [Cetraspora pellucida]|uniref:13965_t:CDS:1 n=1 Tax=Cetraspora pellucida TaxID=1433469 RepID=A0A9N8YWT4_9GLOM|nr:13965_t:CDS:2 [Cetraspora pellucida]
MSNRQFVFKGLKHGTEKLLTVMVVEIPIQLVIKEYDLITILRSPTNNQCDNFAGIFVSAKKLNVKSLIEQPSKSRCVENSVKVLLNRLLEHRQKSTVFMLLHSKNKTFETSRDWSSVKVNRTDAFFFTGTTCERIYEQLRPEINSGSSEVIYKYESNVAKSRKPSNA